MLSNAYFLAKFRFDTAENEPAKKLQKLLILLSLLILLILLEHLPAQLASSPMADAVSSLARALLRGASPDIGADRDRAQLAALTGPCFCFRSILDNGK